MSNNAHNINKRGKVRVFCRFLRKEFLFFFCILLQRKRKRVCSLPLLYLWVALLDAKHVKEVPEVGLRIFHRELANPKIKIDEA